MDINADLGEGAGNDAQIMPLISSCNIACGGHYGDENSIRNTIQLAKKNKVKVGTHWSFPDRQNFGRKIMNLTVEELTNSLDEQLNLFRKVCQEEEIKLHHIKAHGALYNHGANSSTTVKVMMNLLASLEDPPMIYLQENSLLCKMAKGKFPIKKEAFVDRRYADESNLVSRAAPNALITKPQKAWEQFYTIYKHNFVIDIEGQKRKLSADTFCIHGDQPASVEILHYFHQQFQKMGISLK